MLGLALLLAGEGLAQEHDTASADGQEITDGKTGLVWRRCAEGMNWKVKTCSGKAGFFKQVDAAARAKAEAASSGQAGRLPTMKELSSIVSARKASPDEGRAGESPLSAAPKAVRLVRAGK